MLGIKPTRQHRNGDKRVGKVGTVTYRQGLWSLGTEWDTRELAEHLRELLDQLQGKDEAIHYLTQHTKVDFFCGIMDVPGYEIPVDILIRMADLEITFGVCFYGDPEPLENFDNDLTNIKKNRWVTL